MERAPPNGSRLSCAEERFIPQSTRAVSFKRVLGGARRLTQPIQATTGYGCSTAFSSAGPCRLISESAWRCMMRHPSRSRRKIHVARI